MLELTPGPSSSRSCRKFENRQNSTEGQGWRNVGWQHLPRPLTSSRRSSGEKKCGIARVPGAEKSDSSRLCTDLTNPRHLSDFKSSLPLWISFGRCRWASNNPMPRYFVFFTQTSSLCREIFGQKLIPPHPHQKRLYNV